MKPFSALQTSLRVRLISTVAIMLLPWLALAVGAFLYLQRALASLDHVVADPIVEMQSVARLESLLLRTAPVVRDHVLSVDNSARQSFDRLAKRVNDQFAEIGAMPFLTEDERQRADRAALEWSNARTIARDILATASGAGRQQIPQYTARIEAAVEHLDEIHGVVLEEVQEQLSTARNARDRLLLSIFSLFLIAMLIAISAGLLLSRSILRPLTTLEHGAQRFGTGDLSHRIALSNHDELGRLAGAFNEMAGRLENQNAALSELSMRDSLTGLYNRRELQRRLKEEVERSGRYGRHFALLMLDCDHFKRINDKLGHPAGDCVLQEIANTVRTALRATDFVARYGGEEFAVILPETAATGALELAERIRVLISKRIIPVNDTITAQVTVSIGLASFPTDASTERDLVTKADQALYAAKHAGRNQVYQASRIS